jgi:hypothetical protein
VIALQFNRSAFHGPPPTAPGTETFREPLNERERQMGCEIIDDDHGFSAAMSGLAAQNHASQLPDLLRRMVG